MKTQRTNKADEAIEPTTRMGLSRRGFLGGMAAAALGAASTMALAGCAQSDGADAAGGSGYVEGTYTSVQKTPYATAEVSCAFGASGLTSVSYNVVETSQMDYFPLYASALEELCEGVVAAGKTAGVDAVTGATFCSDAILGGVDACAMQALELAAPAPEQKNAQVGGYDSFDGSCDAVFSPIKLGALELQKPRGEERGQRRVGRREQGQGPRRDRAVRRDGRTRRGAEPVCRREPVRLRHPARFAGQNSRVARRGACPRQERDRRHP